MLNFPKKKSQVGVGPLPTPTVAEPPEPVSGDASADLHTLFQCFLQEQRALDPTVDAAVARKIWNEMSDAERRSYGESHQTLLVEESEPKSSAKIFNAKKARISRIAFGNIMKLDPELAGVVSKEAAECMMSSVDQFVEQLVHGSHVALKKKNLKKKALKAEHLYTHMAGAHQTVLGRYWFAKDLLDDYTRAKEAKKRQTQQRKPETPLPKQPVPVEPVPGNHRPITDFFGQRRDPEGPHN